MYTKLHNFNNFLIANLKKMQKSTLELIKLVIFAFRLDDNEILKFFHSIYLFLIEDKIFFKNLTTIIPEEKVLLKFRSEEEMIVTCGVFAKFIWN
jgi:hypothetical protein